MDSQFTVILYRIDSVGTVQTGSRHHVGESRANQKKFLAPVEITARIQAGKPSFKFLAGTGVSKQEYESFSFNVFLSDLEERNVNIRSGDFALFNDGDKERFFEVKTVSTLNSVHGGRGFKPTYMEVTAVLKGDATIPDALKNRF